MVLGENNPLGTLSGMPTSDPENFRPCSQNLEISDFLRPPPLTHSHTEACIGVVMLSKCLTNERKLLPCAAITTFLPDLIAGTIVFSQ